jgi:hypothetical protein
MINLFVIAIGDVAYKEDALYVIKNYFKKFNFVNIFILEEDDETINHKKAHPSWLRLLHHKYIKNDYFTLSWDLDILPTKDSFKIFQHLDGTRLNMCIDNSVILTDKNLDRTIQYSTYLVEDGYRNFKYNAGLIGIPPKFRNFCEYVYETHAPGNGRPSYEQYYFNDEIQKNNLNVNILPTIFNGMYPPEGIDDFIFNKAVNKHYTWGVMGEGKLDPIKTHRINFEKGLI